MLRMLITFRAQDPLNPKKSGYAQKQKRRKALIRLIATAVLTQSNQIGQNTTMCQSNYIFNYYATRLLYYYHIIILYYNIIII